MSFKVLVDKITNYVSHHTIGVIRIETIYREKSTNS